jgi:DNA segregation ATPase FtsK/SpoIIIE-like protein
MDGVIHRTRVKVKKTFPLGEVIIFIGILMLLMLLFLPSFVVSKFIFGVIGAVSFAVFIGVVAFGFIVLFKKRIEVNTKYLISSLILCLSFFTALHLGWTFNEINGSFGEYTDFVFNNLTPGGIVFAVPSFVIFIASGKSIIASMLILVVFHVIASGIIIGMVVVKRGENKVLSPRKNGGESYSEKFAAANSKKYDQSIKTLNEKLDNKWKELVQEQSKITHDKNKSVLGLDAPLRTNAANANIGEPVQMPQILPNLPTPEEINAMSISGAAAFVDGLSMYDAPKYENQKTVYGGQTPPPFGIIQQVGQPPVTPPFQSQQSAQILPQQFPQQDYGQNSGWMPMQPSSYFQPQQQAMGQTPWQPSGNGQFEMPLRSERRVPRGKNAGLEQTMMAGVEEKAPAKSFKITKYVKPTLDLIRTESMDLSQFYSEANEKKTALDALFAQFNVNARVENYTVAPAVTRFEISLETGTRVAQVQNLYEDMNYILRTKNTRMETPIAGKNAMGIEVPNKEVGTVSIKDLLSCREFINHPSPLAICIGKNINNESVIGDLAKMPHLLVAGTTGSGKSVCINSIITSLIYRTSPDDLRLLLVDMKKVELNIYNNIPHMLIPHSITESQQAVNALKWLKVEMKHRYDLFGGQSVNDIALYQSLPAYKAGQLERMPYIVMIIDEAADLMASNRKEVEENIQSLASLSRAAGIHIILATQRPSVNVISGVIKANMVVRIAFRVISAIDSATILDTKGAETLVGRGDMLFKTATGIQRVQGCYIDNEESRRVLSFVRDKNEANFDIELEDIILNGMPDGARVGLDGNPLPGDGPQDPYFVQVLKYAVRENNTKKTLSISEIQRTFAVGFGRAGKIVDQLASAGYISNNGDNKPRDVLITREQVEDLYGS